MHYIYSQSVEVGAMLRAWDRLLCSLEKGQSVSTAQLLETARQACLQKAIPMPELDNDPLGELDEVALCTAELIGAQLTGTRLNTSFESINNIASCNIALDREGLEHLLESLRLLRRDIEGPRKHFLSSQWRDLGILNQAYMHVDIMVRFIDSAWMGEIDKSVLERYFHAHSSDHSGAPHINVYASPEISSGDVSDNYGPDSFAGGADLRSATHTPAVNTTPENSDIRLEKSVASDDDNDLSSTAERYLRDCRADDEDESFYREYENSFADSEIREQDELQVRQDLERKERDAEAPACRADGHPDPEVHENFSATAAAATTAAAAPADAARASAAQVSGQSYAHSQGHAAATSDECAVSSDSADSDAALCEVSADTSAQQLRSSASGDDKSPALEAINAAEELNISQHEQSVVGLEVSQKAAMEASRAALRAADERSYDAPATSYRSDLSVAQAGEDDVEAGDADAEAVAAAMTAQATERAAAEDAGNVSNGGNAWSGLSSFGGAGGSGGSDGTDLTGGGFDDDESDDEVQPVFYKGKRKDPVSRFIYRYASTTLSRWAFNCVFTVLSMLFAIMAFKGALSAISYDKLTDIGQLAEATIVSVEDQYIHQKESRNIDRVEHHFQEIIEFNLPDGKPFRTVLLFDGRRSISDVRPVGTTIDVLYTPDDPSVVMHANNVTPMWLSLLMLLGGLTGMSYCTWLTMRLMRNALEYDRLQAFISSISMILILAVGAAGTYRIFGVDLYWFCPAAAPSDIKYDVHADAMVNVSDGRPFTGRLRTLKDGLFILSTYEDGLRQGTEYIYLGANMVGFYNYSNDNLEGPFQSVDKFGNIEVSGSYRNNHLDGEWTKYDSVTGRVVTTGRWLWGAREGLWTFYRSDGTLYCTENYSSDLLNGAYTEYNPKGGVMLESNYIKDVATGISTRYWPNGNKLYQVSLENGLAHGPFQAFYADGTMLLNGSMHYGSWRTPPQVFSHKGIELSASEKRSYRKSRDKELCTIKRAIAMDFNLTFEEVSSANSIYHFRVGSNVFKWDDAQMSETRRSIENMHSGQEYNFFVQPGRAMAPSSQASKDSPADYARDSASEQHRRGAFDPEAVSRTPKSAPDAPGQAPAHAVTPAPGLAVTQAPAQAVPPAPAQADALDQAEAPAAPGAASAMTGNQTSADMTGSEDCVECAQRNGSSGPAPSGAHDAALSSQGIVMPDTIKELAIQERQCLENAYINREDQDWAEGYSSVGSDARLDHSQYEKQRTLTPHMPVHDHETVRDHDYDEVNHESVPFDRVIEGLTLLALHRWCGEDVAGIPLVSLPDDEGMDFGSGMHSGTAFAWLRYPDGYTITVSVEKADLDLRPLEIKGFHASELNFDIYSLVLKARKTFMKNHPEAGQFSLKVQYHHSH